MADIETRIINILKRGDDWLMDAALSATSSWLDIKGSALTVNREKMRRRLNRAIREAEKRAICGDGDAPHRIAQPEEQWISNP